jgi:hypothetical protein
MFLPDYYRFTCFAIVNRLTWLTKLLYKSPNLVNRIPIFGGLIFKPMETKTQSLKELYEKDFYLWVQENLKLLKNREYDLVDWENLLEEIEDMGQRHYDAMVSYMAVIMEHLYKWENYRKSTYMGSGWKKSIINARTKMQKLFKGAPSLRAKAQEKETLQRAWEDAVLDLIAWFKMNEQLALRHFGRLPTEKDFPQECPYTFQQIMEYEPWV